MNSDRIEDFAVVGGLAHEDEFVAIKKFDTSLDPDDKDDKFFTGDEIESAAPGGFTLTERLDVRQELTERAELRQLETRLHGLPRRRRPVVLR